MPLIKFRHRHNRNLENSNHEFRLEANRCEPLRAVIKDTCPSGPVSKRGKGKFDQPWKRK